MKKTAVKENNKNISEYNWICRLLPPTNMDELERKSKEKSYLLESFNVKTINPFFRRIIIP